MVRRVPGQSRRGLRFVRGAVASGERAWDTLEPLVFTFAARLLRIALERSSLPVDRSRLVLAYVRQATTIERWLEAIMEAHDNGLSLLVSSLRKQVATRFGADTASLARGVLWCVANDPRPTTCHWLSSALLLAPPLPMSPAYREAMTFAKKFGRTRATRVAKKAPRRRTAGQAKLFGDP